MSEIQDHWLTRARRIESANCNQRPNADAIELIVLHNISLPPGSYGGGFIEALFTNCLDCSCHSAFADLEGLAVSSHLLIDREGVVTQFVPFDQRAWHAGQSGYGGRDNCNDFSIGIELEGVDDKPYTEKQYNSLVAVVGQLLEVYPGLNAEAIVGHSDIAPGRKTDPGPAFDWQYFRRKLQHSGESA